jgi:hypothetical protein
VREVDPGGAASIIETDCNVDFDEPVGYKDSKYAEYERVAAEKHKQKQVVAAADQAGGGGQLQQKRSLQKAEQQEQGDDQKPIFVPFAGSAKRIDGKILSAAGSSTSGSSSGSSNTDSGKISSSDNKTGEQKQQQCYIAPARKSMVGNKYSKTGSTMSAFGGKGNVLK